MCGGQQNQAFSKQGRKGGKRFKGGGVRKVPEQFTGESRSREKGFRRN